MHLLQHKKPTQVEKILQLLKDRGARGVFNYEMDNDLHIPRYSSRLHELYRLGYDIRKERRKGGVVRYYLVKEELYGDTD